MNNEKNLKLQNVKDKVDFDDYLKNTQNFTPITRIRNFAIIAHIDHGKSTLSDRLIEICKGVDQRDLRMQILDSLDVERERGITVKAQTVSLQYTYQNQDYSLNLIDTPGHVDFSYEVSRSLIACEGAIVLIDSTQGIQAQTIANIYKAIEANLVLIPVLNKIDLPSSNIESSTKQIHNLLGIYEDILAVSGKTGAGVEQLIQKIIDTFPNPVGELNKEFKALLFDGWFDQFLGIILMIKVIDGYIKPGMSIRMLNGQSSYTVDQVGVFTPKKKTLQHLSSGMVGFVIANIRTLSDITLGDTMVLKNSQINTPILRLQSIKPSVFCCIYPIDTVDYKLLKESLEKLKLHDGSLTVEKVNMPTLGSGFKCGFLGLLHLEVIQQRLEQEFDLNVLMTAPSVEYKMTKQNGDVSFINHPSELPERQKIEKLEEPWVNVTIISPENYLGTCIALCEDKRGEQVGLEYLEGLTDDSKRCILKYKLPLADIIFDFHDKLKSITQGYGSFEYENDDYRESDIVPLHILVDGVQVDALSTMIYKGNAESYGRWVCLSLKDSIDKHLFPIAVQAAIGVKVIARETIPALRKDVTAKCYGGDITRKRKLLEKQKKGKKKMKELMAGKVSVPHKAILKVLRRTQ
ncbi:MAG: elongation factor 4 [Alphaproteobacteria bacterium]|nr:MAG: elongation factor 4 [Alphaproteobacteria bacterium]